MLHATKLEESEELEEFKNEEIAMITKRVTQIIQKKGFFKKRFSKKNYIPKEKNERKQITCYHCKKLEHVKSSCPLLKKTQDASRKKKKVTMATWCDLD